MPKANLTQSVEAIADRISKRNLKNCRAIIQLGTWIKNLQDENRQLKQRIEELEIRVQKLNDYGATMLTRKEADEKNAASAKSTSPITAGQLKRFRMSRQLSQAAMGALLGVSSEKYARWESGKTIMLPAVEDKFRRIQTQKGTQLRTQLQKLGFYQANGKRTKYLKGQDDSGTPASKSPREYTIRENASPSIITKTQLRELRLKLGCTHPQMAARCGVRPKTWSNWEYGVCHPPKDVAESLLSQYKDLVASPSPESEVTHHYVRPTSKRPIYESELMPIAKLRACRKASGLTVKEVAKRIGVPSTKYKNWEMGNSKPTTEYVEKLQEVFGALPTKSVKDSVRIHAIAVQQRTDAVSGYKYPAETLREFREKHHLTRAQMARLMNVTASRYGNWETHGRGVPPNKISVFHVLLKLSSADITRRLNSSPAGQNEKDAGRKEKYTFPAAFLIGLRGQLGVSLTQFAKLVGIPRSQYHNWETSGRGVPPQFESLIKNFVTLDDVAKRKAMKALGIAPSKASGGRK